MTSSNNVLSSTQILLLTIVCMNPGKAGREIVQRFENVTGRGISYGRFYVVMRQLRERGFVSVVDDEDQDGLLRRYRATQRGQQILGRFF